MPKIFYTEDEYESLKHEKTKLEERVDALEQMHETRRMILQTIYEELGVPSLNQAVNMIRHLRKVNALES